MMDKRSATEKDLFFIDLSMQRVFCRLCHKVCRSLKVRDYSLFWCGNHGCDNSEDVRLYPDGTWKVFGFIETMQEDFTSAIESELLLSISSGGDESVRQDLPPG